MVGRDHSMRVERYFYVGTAVISASFLAYIYTQPFAYRPTTDVLGMATFPAVILAGILVGSIVTLVRLRGSQGEMGQSQLRFWPSLAITVGALLGTYGLWYFDPTISCTLLALFLLLVEKIRDWRVLVGIPVVIGLLVSVLFIQVLGVYFPHSLIG